jgi:ankyrin repeat protein
MASRDDEGYTPLMWACYEGDNDRVYQLLKKDQTQVEERDKNGWTPLMHACCAKDNEYIIRTLIASGASVNVTSFQKVTPLMVTFEYSSGNEWVLRIGRAELDALDNKGRTALMYACDAGDTSGMQLCYSGARVDIIDDNGLSALDHALESEEVKLELVHTIVCQMGELKTRSKENDRRLLNLLSRWVEEWVEELEMSRFKAKNQWGGHFERFRLREESYDVARECKVWNPDTDYDGKYVYEFHGLSPLLYACINGKIDFILDLCSQKDTFFSPVFDDIEYQEYQKKVGELAVEAQKTDKYFADNRTARREILFGKQ